MLLPLLGCFLLLAYLYVPVLKEIATICLEDDDYSHGILLPFVTVYLFWIRRAELHSVITRCAQTTSATLPLSPFGMLLLFLGALLYLVGNTANSLFTLWVSFFPVLFGLLALVLRPELARMCYLPLALNFMAKPLPDSLVPRLFNPFQVFAAKVSAAVLDALNVPVHLMGNVIEIPGMKLMVEEACSGMRSLMALLTVALIVASLTKRPMRYQVLLVGVSVLVAIALNVLRVAITGVLAHFYDPRSATGFFHGFSGLIVFVLGLFILYGFGAWIDRRLELKGTG